MKCSFIAAVILIIISEAVIAQVPVHKCRIAARDGRASTMAQCIGIVTGAPASVMIGENTDVRINGTPSRTNKLFAGDVCILTGGFAKPLATCVGVKRN